MNRRLITVTVCCGYFVAVGLAAQSHHAVGVYISRNDALPDAPNLGGLHFTSFSGPLALRLNGGLHFLDRHRAMNQTDHISVDAWSVDADVMLAPFHDS